ncbi:hypothetical protein NKR23_g6984 [Pleurostoma richardsiae]|uniref:Mediator of RNA polymerase II transcription subunit 11 n=1 Tax=Pleurostoma richardsiae TaxID=41990 RepID=A0AA38R958_9PEZI|nr:hypothetical protein NKR23_g6984 [Pleurostoma richardsiae]
MDTTNDDPSASGTLVNEPFTRAERIQQLSVIDHDITTLLSWTGKAVQSLSAPSQPPSSADANDQQQQQQQQQTEAFKSAVDAFLATLHSVDVRLKRQIMGLEEAGIVTLKDAKAASAATGIEPDGVGNIGGLDVGWLNSRGNKVERDMEAELWTKARAHLEGLAGAGEAHQAGVGQDVEMS